MSSRSTEPSASCSRGSKASPTVESPSPAAGQNSLPSASRSARRHGATARQCRRLERQLKVVHDGQKLLHHVARGVVAKLGLLALGALARIVKLRLQPGQAVEQLVALGLQLVIRGAANRFSGPDGRLAASPAGATAFQQRVRFCLGRSGGGIRPVPLPSTLFPVRAYLYDFSETLKIGLFLICLFTSCSILMIDRPRKAHQPEPPRCIKVKPLGILGRVCA
jgi:hypothetical protein